MTATRSQDGNGAESALPREPPKRRFWIRGVSCVIAPPVITGYYIWTYAQFVHTSKAGREENSPTPDGRHIWWSWFILGALGLNISEYVLAGVEVGMLTVPRFGALNVDQLLMHRDRSWGRVSEWANAVLLVFRKWNQLRLATSPVWLPLFAVSVLSWAFPLTGLTMDTKDAFKPGQLRGVNVVGANEETFNDRNATEMLAAAYRIWGKREEEALPRNAVFYSEQRTAGVFNISGGNTLPSSAEKPIFLAPQAELPVHGEKVWGLVFKYRCEVVTELARFELLSRRINSSAESSYLYGPKEGAWNDPKLSKFRYPPPHAFYRIADHPKATISVLSLTSEGAVLEIALSQGIEALRSAERGYTTGSWWDEDVLEAVLWQDSRKWLFEESIGRTNAISDLDGEYFLRERVGGTPNTPLWAYGVQCKSSSAVGTATLDGFSGTFRDFQPRKMPLYRAVEGGSATVTQSLPRLGNAVPAMFLPGFDAEINETLQYERYRRLLAEEDEPISTNFTYFEVPNPGGVLSDLLLEWEDTLREAAGLREERAFTTDPFTIRALWPLAASDLQTVLEAAYRANALALMYHDRAAFGSSWFHEWLTPAEPWTQLVPVEVSKGVPVVLVLVMLVFWALGCMILGIIYGFRERWDAYFTTRSMYWYCVKLAGVDPVEVFRS